MCERCDLIDYPIADIWRPCWQPTPNPIKVIIDDGRELADENRLLQRQLTAQADRIHELEAQLKWPHLEESRTPAPKLIET